MKSHNKLVPKVCAPLNYIEAVFDLVSTNPPYWGEISSTRFSSGYMGN